MAESAGRTALLAGGSGMVGARLLPMLLNAGEYARVQALSRRPLPLDHPRLANRVVRFDQSLATQLKGLKCQHAFCCLGTTMRDAGSREAFRAVDHDLVLEFAGLALAAGAERFVIVSAVGADSASRNFYLRVKGEMERTIESPALSRPGHPDPVGAAGRAPWPAAAGAAGAGGALEPESADARPLDALPGHRGRYRGGGHAGGRPQCPRRRQSLWLQRNAHAGRSR